MRTWLVVVALTVSSVAWAQRVDTLGPQVRKYARVTTRKVILEHVEIIDGTGAAPKSDRNLVIEDGKLTAISAGVDEAPRPDKDGVGYDPGKLLEAVKGHYGEY